MKLRIESDGTTRNTHLFTEGGELIEGVKHIIWEADVGGGIVACTVSLRPVRLDAVADAQLITERSE